MWRPELEQVRPVTPGEKRSVDHTISLWHPRSLCHAPDCTRVHSIWLIIFNNKYQKIPFFRDGWLHCYYFEYKIRPLGVTWCWSDTDWHCNETWRDRYKFLVTNQRQQFKQNKRVEGSRLQYWSSQSVSLLMKLSANIDNNYDRRWGGRRLFGHLWT